MNNTEINICLNTKTNELTVNTENKKDFYLINLFYVNELKRNLQDDFKYLKSYFDGGFINKIFTLNNLYKGHFTYILNKIEYIDKRLREMNQYKVGHLPFINFIYENPSIDKLFTVYGDDIIKNIRSLIDRMKKKKGISEDIKQRIKDFDVKFTIRTL